MQKLSIPTCYFPSTALFLDDNRDFLLNFVLQLDERVAYRIFDNPSQALEYMHNKKNGLNFWQPHCLRDAGKESSPPFQNYLSDVTFSAIQDEVYNPNRFTEISVVVVDYAMPGMDGLEFCRQIENPNVKKILLTGQANEKQAIEAFHEGLIHRYIKKNDVNASELITKSIYELQLQYFQAMSDEVEKLLPVQPPRCLQDKAFANFFFNYMNEHHIAEYYLAESSGSFLMLDDDANASFFVLKSREEMQALAEVAKSQNADESVVNALAQCKKMPGLWQKSELGSDAIDWANSLIEAHQIDAGDVYYFSVLKGNDLFNIRQPKILSYYRYLEELDAEALLMN